MMKLVKTTLAGCALALPLLVLSPHTASAKPVCVTGGGNDYRLASLPKNSKGKVIAGVSLTYPLPIVAAGFVAGNGDRIVTFTENFNWISGGYVHPASAVYFKFPAGWPDSGTATFEYTYHGNGDPANSSQGNLTVIPCP